jgi:hypothetical protein
MTCVIQTVLLLHGVLLFARVPDPDPFGETNGKPMPKKQSTTLKSRRDRLQADAVRCKLEKDGSEVILVSVAIDDGWYAYAGLPGVKNADPDQFSIEVHGGVDPKSTKIEYPPSIEVTAPGEGIWRKYEGKFVVRVKIRAVQNSDVAQSQPEITVRYFITDGMTCGPVESRKVDVRSRK